MSNIPLLSTLYNTSTWLTHNQTVKVIVVLAIGIIAISYVSVYVSSLLPLIYAMRCTQPSLGNFIVGIVNSLDVFHRICENLTTAISSLYAVTLVLLDKMTIVVDALSKIANQLVNFTDKDVGHTKKEINEDSVSRADRLKLR